MDLPHDQAVEPFPQSGSTGTPKQLWRLTGLMVPHLLQGRGEDVLLAEEDGSEEAHAVLAPCHKLPKLLLDRVHAIPFSFGDTPVGVYLQACSGIPLAVRFVGRD